MAGNGNQTIIVKRISKGGHGHHGGAWKVAYADFVTAMMAFFLLLWLLNAVTQEQLEGISNYFAPISAAQTKSGSGGILGGKVLSEEGAMPNVTSRPSVSVDLPPPRAGSGGEASPAATLDASAEEALKRREEQQFEEAKAQLEKTIASIPNMKQLMNSLLIDNTPEGLRIQLVDQDGLAMFPSGNAKMFLHTRRLMEMVAKVVEQMPQDVKISGHTDAVKFATDTGYTNWELSADRANASRRALEEFGVPATRIAEVVGKAANEPLLRDDPNNARNRRLEIILLRGTGREKTQPKPTPEALPGLRQIERGAPRDLPQIVPAPAPARKPT